MAGQTLIEKKIANQVVRVTVTVLYWSVTCGLAMGTISTFKTGGFENTPAYLMILIGTGAVLAIASLVGAIVGLAYAIYKFVGKMSRRFPILENVWNQFCPVQTVRFLE